MLEFYLSKIMTLRSSGFYMGTFLRNVHSLKLGLSVEARLPQGSPGSWGQPVSLCPLAVQGGSAPVHLGPRKGKDTSTRRGRPNAHSISAFCVSASPVYTVRIH